MTNLCSVNSALASKLLHVTPSNIFQRVVDLNIDWEFSHIICAKMNCWTVKTQISAEAGAKGYTESLEMACPRLRELAPAARVS